MTGPGYDAVVIAHVLAAVVGFGALGATGAYAAALRRDPTAAGASLRRYFRPGRNWAARAILLVPVLGATLLVLGHGRDVGRVFPWIGLGLWTVAVSVASAVLWPAERAVQRLLAAATVAVPAGAAAGGEGDGADLDELVAACARCERAAALTSVLFVVALVVMVAQP